MQKIHRNLFEAVVEGLESIFNEGLYADKVVEKLLKKDKKWGAKDRGFIAETIYEIVRYKRLYCEISEVKKPYNKEDLTRVFAVWTTLKGLVLPEWLGEVPTRRIRGRYEEARKVRKVRESVEDWMDELCEGELGSELWERELASLNKEAEVVLRANRLKITAEELRKELMKLGIEARLVKGYADAVVLANRGNVFGTELFKNGYFEVQDASSQKVAYALDVQEGMRVADCCAGAGGKTLHIASLMGNRGKILAMDIYENKLEELKRRARRNGVFNIETKVVDNKAIKRMAGSFDRVLIDAPCSGLGVLRRNPDAKWKLRSEFIDEIKKTQVEILASYSKLVKEGGKLVYSTCSILPSENGGQVDKFLASEAGKEFKKLRDEAIFASESGFDGFYICEMVREG